MDNWSIYYRIGSFSVPKNRKKRGDAILQGGSLTIYDTEEAYVEALSDYLNKNMGYSSGNLLPLITILGLSYGGPFLHYTD